METSESTENQRNYYNSTHAEFRGGVFNGAINLVSGGPRRRTEILEWISTVPYTNHHRRISEDRLEGTGKWILEKEEYRHWRASTGSMLLLLRGIPGAGKTYIASQVIDWFLSNSTEESKLVYFYCNRAEQSRRDPESILRTLVQQFAQPARQDQLLTPVIKVYKDREEKGQLSSRLTLKECQDILVQLIAIYPQTTICIDALDEVDHRLRFRLLWALKHVVERSNTRVKIFATARMDTDILMQFEMFPRIELEPDDNVDDINRFVKEKVQETVEQKRLLHGNVPDPLKYEICQVLCERSRGMFQLAALQITLLCDMVTTDDVRNSLRVLPETLTDAYGEIYNRILEQKGSAPRLALNAFRWVQCSYEPLRSETLLDAITAEADSSGEFSHQPTALSATDLLKACQNLLILDECLHVFRFAHLSVEEYLETKLPKVDSHTEIAKICLSLLCSSRSWTDYDMTVETGEGLYHDRHLLLYSAVFWPWHLNHCKDTCQILAALWETFFSAATFQRWIDYHNQSAPFSPFTEDNFWENHWVLRDEEYDRLSTILVFGLGRKPTSISESQYGCTVNIKLKFSSTFVSETVQRDRAEQLLLYASTVGDLDIALQLLDVGFSAAAANLDVDTALFYAAEGEQEALACQLVERGADVSATDHDEGTPLHVAARNGLEVLAGKLVDQGADVSAADFEGWTPLHVAARFSQERLAQLLLDRGADPSAVDDEGRTPLHFPVKYGLEAQAQLLLDRGADPSAADYKRKTPLHFAAKNGHEALAQLLMDRGADPSAADYKGKTPLHFAAKNGHEALAQLLLDRGADPSAADYKGKTPLHVPAESEHEALAQMLLDRDADVSAADCDWRTPLHAAAMGGREGLARLLVYRGADASASDSDGWTPMHDAAWSGHEVLAGHFVGLGANVVAADGDGLTPLHLAAWNGQEALARYLLGGGADVSAADGYGQTPLHLAAKNGHEALAKLLVEYGADITATNRDGSTPLHLAAENGHVVVAQLLAAATVGLSPYIVATLPIHDAVSVASADLMQLDG